MPLYRKEICFDLDTKKLKKYFSNISQAYKDIQHTLENHNFIHRQGSVYNSIKPMSDIQLSNVVDELCHNHPWLNDCVREIDFANIGRYHSLKPQVKTSCEKYFNILKDQLLNNLNEKNNKETKSVIAINCSKNKLSLYDVKEIASFYNNLYQRNLLNADYMGSKDYNIIANEIKIGIIYDMLAAGLSESRISLVCANIPDFSNKFVKDVLSSPQTKLYKNKIFSYKKKRIETKHNIMQ